MQQKKMEEKKHFNIFEYFRFYGLIHEYIIGPKWEDSLALRLHRTGVLIMEKFRPLGALMEMLWNHSIVTEFWSLMFYKEHFFVWRNPESVCYSELLCEMIPPSHCKGNNGSLYLCHHGVIIELNTSMKEVMVF